jgi:hypothetical protein
MTPSNVCRSLWMHGCCWRSTGPSIHVVVRGEIPILTTAQREVVDRAKALVRFKEVSLIPRHLSYKQQLGAYVGHCRRAGLDHMHGLRHAYAQRRFEGLAGFPCPAAGGASRAQLTPEQRETDYDARLLVSAELGHAREAITAAYLGR